MKTRSVFAIFTSTILSAGLSHGALVGFWPFDEGTGTNAANAQGNAAFDATLGTNSAWGAGVSGVGSSLELDGSFDSAARVTGLNNSFSSVTITGWINPDVAPAAWTGIFGSRAGGVNQVGFGFRNATGTLTYTWNGNSNTTWDWDSGLNVPIGEWSYVALTLTPGEATVYLGTAGGGLVSAVNGIAHVTESGGNWAVGIDDCCGNARNLDGRIDDLAIFDHALTPDEHALLFTGAATPLNVPEPGVFGLLGIVGMLFLLRRRGR